MRISASALHALWRIFIICLLLVLLLSAGLTYFVQRDSRALLQGYLDDLAAAAGLSITFDTLDVRLLPLPSLAVSNVVITADDMRFSVAYATLTPNYLALLRGRLLPGDVVLLRPRVQGRVAVPLDATDALAPIFAGKGREGFLPALPDGCRVRIVQGEARLHGSEETRLDMQGLQCDLKARAPGALSGSLQWQVAAVYRGEALRAGLEDFSCSGEGDLSAPLTATPNLRLMGRWHYASWLESLVMNMHFRSHAGGWQLETTLSGDLRKDASLLPFTLHGLCSGQAGQARLDLVDVDLALDADSGRFSGVLTLPAKSEDFSLKGSLQMHRLSLTQWLGFARNLAPGLQLALDNIIGARLDFHLDGQGLRVPFIEAHCSGALFRGSGGVESWQQPVVALDLKTERVNLGFGIPEAVGRPPLAPHFFHAPLTPLPDTPLQPGETGIGYDIRLSADRVDYGPLHIQDGAVVISPDKHVKNGFRDCIISARGNFYGGRLDGQCVLGGSTDLFYAISLRAAGVNGLPLSKDMPILPMRSGRYDAEVGIKSQGRELERFLSQLKGHVQIRAQRGSLGLPESRNGLDFKQLDAGLQLRSASWKEGRLGLDGQWSAQLEHKDSSGQARLDGRLWFGEDRDGQGTVVIRAVPAQADMRLHPSLTALPEAVQLKLGGKLSCRGEQVDITEARLQTLGMDAGGQARIRMGRGGTAWQGTLSVHCPDVQAALRRILGGQAKVPAKLNSVSWQCGFKGTARELTMDKLHIQLDASRISGSLKFALRDKKPLLGFDLEVDRLDLSRYLNDKEKSALQATSGKTGGKSWDFSYMRAFDAQGTLRIRDLRGWRVGIQDVRLPLKLENGLLHNGPATGRFYGGSLQGQSSIDFSRGLRFNAKLSIRDFDLATVSRDMDGDAVLSGTASMESDLHAALTGPGQMPAALDGLWNFAVIRGSYQERRANGSLKGSPTRFDLASASGNFKSGICRSGDFKLQGADLQVRGGGMVDLNKRVLDCNLTVDMGRFNDIPVRLHGSLDKPETSIGTGTIIFAAIGGIVHGFMDVLGGILEGTWKIFR